MSSGIEVGDIFGRDSGPATALLRSPVILFASIGFWGINVFFFKLFDIDHVAILNHDNGIRKSESEDASRNSTQETGMKRTEDVEPGRRKSECMVPDQEVGSAELSRPRIKRNKDLIHELPPGSSLPYLDANIESDNIKQRHKKSSFYKQVDETQSESAVVMLLSTSVALLALLYVTSIVWIHIFYGTTIGAVFFFYAMLFLALIIPLQETRWMRSSFKQIGLRVLALIRPRLSCFGFSEPKPIPFIDVFMADAMCSLSKVSYVDIHPFSILVFYSNIFRFSLIGVYYCK
jgi:hypothetical protein